MQQLRISWSASSFITDKTPWSSPDDISGPGSLSTGGYGESKGREENKVASSFITDKTPGSGPGTVSTGGCYPKQKRSMISPSGKPVTLFRKKIPHDALNDTENL